MKKFEIVNNKWIKKIGIGDFTNAIKINTISKIQSGFSEKDYNGYVKPFPYSIFLSTDCDDMALDFNYSKSEKEDYEKDLKFLEDLLYNQ